MSNRQKGFSLVELMVAIVILGILFGIAMPSLAGAIERARLAQVKKNITIFQNLIESYNIDAGEYPIFVQEVEQAQYKDEMSKMGNPFHLAGNPTIGNVGWSDWLVYKTPSGGIDLGRGGFVLNSCYNVNTFQNFRYAGSTAKYYQGAVLYFPFTHASGGNSRWAGYKQGFSGGTLATLLTKKSPVIGYGLIALDGAGDPIPSSLVLTGEKIQCTSGLCP